jgi:CRP-like cAMP-binding protein
MSVAFPVHLPLIRHLELLAPLNAGDIEVLQALPIRTGHIGARQDLNAEACAHHDLCIVLDGLACRSKATCEGARQILSLHIAGEIVDLPALFAGRMDCSISAITALRVGYVARDALLRTLRDHPHLASAFSLVASADAAIAREWICNLGRRSARERVAHLLCEFYVRTSAAGLAEDGVIDLPLTQSEFADATGISVVHVNRVLKGLRHDNLLRRSSKRYILLDWPGLKRAAGFDERYLNLRAMDDSLDNAIAPGA